MEKGRGGKGEESGGEEDGREGEEGRKVEKKPSINSCLRPGLYIL